MTIPGKKNVYRLYGMDGTYLVDVLMLPDEPAPEPGKRFLVRNPFVVSNMPLLEEKRCLS